MYDAGAIPSPHVMLQTSIMRLVGYEKDHSYFGLIILMLTTTYHAIAKQHRIFYNRIALYIQHVSIKVFHALNDVVIRSFDLLTRILQSLHIFKTSPNNPPIPNASLCTSSYHSISIVPDLPSPLDLCWSRNTIPLAYIWYVLSVLVSLR